MNTKRFFSSKPISCSPFTTEHRHTQPCPLNPHMCLLLLCLSIKGLPSLLTVHPALVLPWLFCPDRVAHLSAGRNILISGCNEILSQWHPQKSRMSLASVLCCSLQVGWVSQKKVPNSRTSSTTAPKLQGLVIKFNLLIRSHHWCIIESTQTLTPGGKENLHFLWWKKMWLSLPAWAQAWDTL